MAARRAREHGVDALALTLRVAPVALVACSLILGVKGDRELPAGGEGNDAGAQDSGAPFADASDGLGAIDAAFDHDLANAHADDAVQALLLHFWNAASFLEAPSRPAAPSALALAWEVVAAAAERHERARFVGAVRTFYDLENKAGWKFDRYDDENAMVLALLRAFDITGDDAYLLQARLLYRDIMAAWDTTCCTPEGITMRGGVWHDRAEDRKSTAVNAGAVISGARLFERTKLSVYLSFAKQVYDYWSTSMVDPKTYQVKDNVSPTAVQSPKYTYDQGLMIGASVALAHATGDAAPLANAHKYAAFMLANEVDARGILSDGNAAACLEECAQYKGIAAQYLAELYAADRAHSEYVAMLIRCAESLVSVRDASGVFGPDWGATGGPLTLSATASAAMALASLASLGAPVTSDPIATGEAEEGTLHGVGLEAMYQGFAGWGYVSAWGCLASPALDPGCKKQDVDGQSVTVDVHAPADGPYDLTIRYAAIIDDRNATQASRRLVVNDGAFVIDTLGLKPTQSWTFWNEEKLAQVPLRAGRNQVSLSFDSGHSSYGYINLDHIVASGCPMNAAQNLLQAQPAPADWDPTFSGPFTLTVEGDSPCGEPILRWRNSGVPIKNWIKIYPRRAPFNAPLVPGQTYEASITMSGYGTYFLDIWDGGNGALPDGGASGKGDNWTAPVALTSEPHTFTVPFRMGIGSDPEFQVRVDGPGQAVDVDVTLWHLTIVAK
jgi:predicted alpha-1,6-mannanase (GH76 family)